MIFLLIQPVSFFLSLSRTQSYLDVWKLICAAIKRLENKDIMIKSHKMSKHTD